MSYRLTKSFIVSRNVAFGGGRGLLLLHGSFAASPLDEMAPLSAWIDECNSAIMRNTVDISASIVFRCTENPISLLTGRQGISKNLLPLFPCLLILKEPVV